VLRLIQTASRTRFASTAVKKTVRRRRNFHVLLLSIWHSRRM